MFMDASQEMNKIYLTFSKKIHNFITVNLLDIVVYLQKPCVYNYSQGGSGKDAKSLTSMMCHGEQFHSYRAVLNNKKDIQKFLAH